MNSQLLINSVDLLFYGMGIVFAFLMILVVVTTVMSSLVVRFFPEKSQPIVAVTAPTKNVDSLTLKIIQSALDQHRSRQK